MMTGKEQMVTKGATFGATFGMESKAGDIALTELKGKEREKFCAMVQTYYQHLERCYSEVVAKLLLDSYIDRIDNGRWKDEKLNSFKKNALTTMYKERVRFIENYEAKMIYREWWRY